MKHPLPGSKSELFICSIILIGSSLKLEITDFFFLAFKNPLHFQKPQVFASPPLITSHQSGFFVHFAFPKALGKERRGGVYQLASSAKERKAVFTPELQWEKCSQCTQVVADVLREGCSFTLWLNDLKGTIPGT